MRERLAYLHLPKAAGTSFRAALSGYYAASATAPWSFDPLLFGDDPRLGEVREPVFLGEPAELRGYDYLEGHFSLPTVRAAFDAADIVCILREPRARFLSHYTFWRGWPDWMHDLWEPYDGAKHAQSPLSEYATEPRIAHQADNLATRLIVGEHPLIPIDGHIRPEHVDALAAEGMARLDELGFVDVLERGDQVVRDLEVWFGSSLTEERLNETDLARGEPVDVDDLLARDTVALVHDRNAIDLRLWSHVAAGRGMEGETARRIADVSFARSLAHVAASHTRPDTAPAPEELQARLDAVESEAAALRNEVDAWRRSRLVRMTAPLRRLRGRS